MNIQRIVFVLAAGLVLVLSPVFAHHGTAGYDMTALISVKGTVTKYEYSNPHGLIYLEVKNEKGDVGEWKGELGSLGMLTRANWTEDTLKPGDQITMYGNRAKNGEQLMWVNRIVLPNGQELPAPQPRKPT